MTLHNGLLDEHLVLDPLSTAERIESIDDYSFSRTWVPLVLDCIAANPDASVGDLAHMLVAVRERYVTCDLDDIQPRTPPNVVDGLTPAAEWLAEYMAEHDYVVRGSDAHAAARKHGFSVRQMQRAREVLGVVSSREGRRSTWTLESDDAAEVRGQADAA